MSSKFLISAESSCALFSTAARCDFSDSRFAPDGSAGAAVSSGCRGPLDKSLAAAPLFDDDSPILRGAGSSRGCGRRPPLLTGGAAAAFDLAAGPAVEVAPADFCTEDGPKAS